MRDSKLITTPRRKLNFEEGYASSARRARADLSGESSRSFGGGASFSRHSWSKREEAWYGAETKFLFAAET